jgi:hypothetical protein
LRTRANGRGAKWHEKANDWQAQSGRTYPAFLKLIFQKNSGNADNGLKLELDSQERRAVGKSLVERRGRLIEKAEDTTQPRAAKRSALRELTAIKSVLRKLRSQADSVACAAGERSKSR